MCSSERWKEDLYNEVFQSRLEYLGKRKGKDPSFDLGVMEKILDAEYRKQDLAWSGKSPIQEITEAATIAAYEHFKAQWSGK